MTGSAVSVTGWFSAVHRSEAVQMRNVIFGGANSLDNYLARPNHAVDWILWSDEASSVMADYWKTFDTILMGRKTYEVALGLGRGTGSPGMKTYVFSRTLKSSDANVTVISGDAAEFVRDLKSQEGKHICVMGGGELAKSLLEAGVIDEIGLNIHPLLLGSGIPLFHQMKSQINLELKECKPFKNGCVLLTAPDIPRETRGRRAERL
jgi:dihydrofolate reductase